MADPNFPPNLNINPLLATGETTDSRDQQRAISKYGIAGRVWEASLPLVQYLTPDARTYDPPCSLFGQEEYKVLELGSGQALPSLHLAQHLKPTDLVVLSDLFNVIDLCRERVSQWDGVVHEHAKVEVIPLGWGEDPSAALALGPFTHILLCDLVYFPHLYPPLLRTLLEVTESSDTVQDETFGPEIILSYKSRTLNLEESFFDAFGRYFQMKPVVGIDDAKIYICRRWRITTEWTMPGVNEVMNGGKGVVRGRDFGFEDQLFASIEW